MRRTKLIWFAAGVAVAMAVNLVAIFIFGGDADKEASTYFVVWDRNAEYPKDSAIYSSQIVEKNPEFLRECRIKHFLVWTGDGSLHGQGVVSGFEPSKQSAESVSCVLEQLEQGRLFGEIKLAAHPNDLAPVVVAIREQIAKNAQTH